MKVLSLFDGMSCGMLAMMAAGIDVEAYDAYEIDKYAVTASKHNFPQIEQHGDVFEADFTQYQGYDFLVGGSPCTYWSIAQRPDKRETVASGLGWELFSQYVRALREAQPRMFIYENNKSMSKDIRASITETFGFEPICINSALVSAQNRQRLYWVGVRNEDGTYRKASIEQPADRGILLKDVLDSAVPWRGRAHAETATQYGGASLDHHMRKGQRNLVAEPVGETAEGKSYAVTAYYSTGQNAPHTLTKSLGSMVAEPAAMRQVGRRVGDDGHRHDNDKSVPHFQRLEINDNSQQTNALATVSKDNLIAEPVGKAASSVGNMYGKGQNGALFSLESKTKTLSAGTGDAGNGIGSSNSPKAILPVAVPQEKPTKEQRVYEVKDGMIEVNGKRYPIKLKDGRYIIRKLTVTECMRLQTVPEWYDFSCVSNTQAYKMLGNGWTVEVIAHLIRGAIKSSILGI